MINTHGDSAIKDLQKEVVISQRSLVISNMFSKFKVTSAPNSYSRNFPLVEVYEAEIGRLRRENEFLKVQIRSLVVQLKEALAEIDKQEARNASFFVSQNGLFQLSKSARNTKKRKIKNVILQSVKELEEFVPIELCLFQTFYTYTFYTIQYENAC